MTPALRLLAIALLLALAAVRAPSGAGAPVTPLTLDATYASMRDALTREGRVARITIETDAVLGAQAYRQSTKILLDARAGIARSDVATSYAAAPAAPQRHTTIVTDTAATLLEDGKAPLQRAPHRCRNAPSAALSLLLGCRGAVEREQSVRLAAGLHYEGTAAVAIVSESELHGRDGVMRFIDTLYIDATTFLPLALRSDGRGDTTSAATARYSVDFIDAIPEAVALFTPPASTQDDAATELLLAAIPGGYWLGRDFRVADDQPALALQAVFVAEAGALPYAGARARIVYRASDDARAPDALTLQIWDAAAWRTSASARALPAIELDGAVIAIDTHASAYASADAVAAIIAGLRRSGE